MHYHLLVQDEGDRLSKAVGHLNQVYTQQFNAVHDRDGGLLRGRFKSRLVQQEVYLAELVRYIHANPVAAGMVPRAGDYPWSSHHAYLTGATPAWLRKSEVLRLFGGDAAAGRQALDTFVHARVPPEIARELEWRRSAAILGDEAFKKAQRDRARASGRQARHDVTGERAWLDLQCDEVLAAVAEHCGVAKDAIAHATQGRVNHPRQAALLLSVELTAATAKDVAGAFRARPASIAPMASHYRKRAQQDPALRAILVAVRRKLLGEIRTRDRG